MYDAIIVGARCAGSPTAMLLARKGYRVLIVDRASFPSDTISTHIIWPRGMERLKQWGLLEKIAATNCPRLSSVSFDVGAFALKGGIIPHNGVADCYAPRRTILDQILVDAAVNAGAELRENCTVEELLTDGDTVIGIRYAGKAGTGTERSRIVIGADGINSFVARSVEAAQYQVKPKLACWYYAYWSGVHTDGVEFFLRPERAIGWLPTNDDLVCVPVAAPQREFDRYRDDIEGTYMRSLELVPDLAERAKNGRRQTRFFGTGDVQNFFRKPFGHGWALVGDAGYHKDPIGAQGISDAFHDAERLAAALDEGLLGRRPLDEALAECERSRNEEVMPMYEFNANMASLEPPPPELQDVLAALRGNQPEIDRYFGVLAGTVPVPEFFAPEHLQQIKAAAAG